MSFLLIVNIVFLFLSLNSTNSFDKICFFALIACLYACSTISLVLLFILFISPCRAPKVNLLLFASTINI